MGKPSEKTIICPFYRMQTDCTITCECCRLKFPDRGTTAAYELKYCCTNNWQACTPAKSLLEWYDSKEEYK